MNNRHLDREGAKIAGLTVVVETVVSDRACEMLNGVWRSTPTGFEPAQPG